MVLGCTPGASGSGRAPPVPSHGYKEAPVQLQGISLESRFLMFFCHVLYICLFMAAMMCGIYRVQLY